MKIIQILLSIDINNLINMWKKLSKDNVGSVLRHTVGVAGGILISQGIADGEIVTQGQDAVEAAAGAALTITAFVSSIIDKRRRKKAAKQKQKQSKESV